MHWINRNLKIHQRLALNLTDYYYFCCFLFLLFFFFFYWGCNNIQHIASSLLIMLGMSPQNLHTSTCMPYYFFPLASSSLWQSNYYFQQYPDMQIENCTQQHSSFFLTGWWFVRCLRPKRFSLSFSFFSSTCFSQNYGQAHYTVNVSKLKRIGQRGQSGISENQKQVQFSPQSRE